ncbi:M23 family metallopeptidase [Pseudokordiimonas caeni]|uniref:M23 family metallopeptidase n=1 Tax=Pseudokordiimonas caeni TaxID=2997908 RepID=UPI0028123ADF|nr:M23 family metallopeptidase [Pseudokordiimonas caeni]
MPGGNQCRQVPREEKTRKRVSRNGAKGLKALKNLYTRLDGLRLRYFPERQLFLRSEGRVRFLTIGSYTQVALSGLLLLFVLWGLVATIAYVSRDLTLDAKNRTIKVMSANMQSVTEDLSTLENDVERRAAKLERRQQYLEEIVDQIAPPRPEAEGTAESPAAEEAEEATGDKTATLAPSVFETPAETEGPVTGFLREIFNAGDAHASLPDAAESRSDALAARFAEMDLRQRSVARSLALAIDGKMETLDTILQPTKLRSEQLAPKGRSLWHPASYLTTKLPGSEFGMEYEDPAFVGLKEKWDQYQNLLVLLEAFPAAEPAADYYISSRFGSRRDPFSNKWKSHKGLDLAGWPGTAIYATGAGKVIKSGKWGPYGNMIEIDHGNGLRTRYGHMRRLRVSVGEIVAAGQQIGDMGRTGRATSSHLHYEIWQGDRILDPMPFLKVAADVRHFQRKQERTDG